MPPHQKPVQNRNKQGRKADIVTLQKGPAQEPVLKKEPGREPVLKTTRDQSLLNRLKKSGLDPQRLLDLSLPGAGHKGKAKARHNLIIAAFLFLVCIPSALFTAYMFLVASDQYHSTTAFAVRSSQTSPATEVLGLVLDSGSESTTSNSYIVNDYLRSQAILEDLPSSVNVQEIFNREGSDWLFRMGRDLPIEDQLAFWNRMVDVSYDSTSGVIFVEVRSFHPEDSTTLAAAILHRSEELVNQLSETSRRQTVRFAEETVARAEARLKAIRKQLLAYREQTQEVSPEHDARIATEMIAGLDQRVASKEAERKTLETYLDADSPRIRMLSQEISALRAQIADERLRLGTGSNSRTAGNTNNGKGDRASISFRIADYSELALEEEFARQLYTTALAGLEQARQEADNKSLYLATFINPTLSQDAQYPHRFLYSLAFFLLLGGTWVVVVLMYYNIRDRS